MTIAAAFVSRVWRARFPRQHPPLHAPLIDLIDFARATSLLMRANANAAEGGPSRDTLKSAIQWSCRRNDARGTDALTVRHSFIRQRQLPKLRGPAARNQRARRGLKQPKRPERDREFDRSIDRGSRFIGNQPRYVQLRATRD